MRAVTYSFGSYQLSVSGYHWATAVLDQVSADRASELAEHLDRPEGFDKAEGIYPLGERTPGRLTFPTSPRLPSGLVLLRDAILGFCASREGKPANKIDLPRFQELIEPIHTALLDERIKVICLSREGGRTTVTGDAFVDEETWPAVVYASNPVPIRPKVGIEDGLLVVYQANFDDVVGVAAPSAPSLIGETTSNIPPYLRFMLEVADRLDLTEDYNFNKEFMGKAMQAISDEAEWAWLKLTPSGIEAMSRLLGDPQFADVRTGRKGRTTTPPPPDYISRTGPERNQGRPEDPRVPYNAVYMKPKKDRPIQPQPSVRQSDCSLSDADTL